MRVIQLIIVLMFASIPAIAGCLPDDVKETDIVGHETVTSRSGQRSAKAITVKEAVKRLGGRCRKGKLVDRKGKEVRFYKLQGCWGNPPADYLEILDRQARELADLKRRYTVIEITCNPGGIDPRSIV